MKIYIYGTGRFGVSVFADLRHHADVIGFVTSIREDASELFMGLPVLVPNELELEKFDYLLICSEYWREMEENVRTVFQNCEIGSKMIVASKPVDLISFYQMCYMGKAIDRGIGLFIDIGVSLTGLNPARFVVRLHETYEILEQKLVERLSGLPSDSSRIADRVIKARNRKDLSVDFAASRKAKLGNGAEGKDSIVFVAISVSAGHFIAQSLTKRLGRKFIGCATGIYPGGSFIFESLLALLKDGAVTHSHSDPSSLNVKILKAAGVKRLVVHLRDPRSALLSFTHHVGVSSRPGEMWLYIPLIAPGEDFYLRDFSSQIDWMIDVYFPFCIDWMRGWIELADGDEFDVLLTTFEDFKIDSEGFFNKILDHYEIPKESFSPEKLSEEPGEYFLRRGALEEWRERCTPEQIARMEEVIPESWYARFGWKRYS